MTESQKLRKKRANAKRNMLKGIKGDIGDAKRNRSHGNGSGGGRLPSAEYVGSASEVKRRDGSGRTAFSAEGAERYDDRGPAPTANAASHYRAPSMTVVRAPVRPKIEPDFGRVGRGAPAVRAPEVAVDEAIARRNAYARRGDYSGEGPALLPLPKIEVHTAYPRPETVRVTVLRGPELSIVELNGHKAPAKLSFNHAPGRVRALRVRVRWGAAGHMPPEVVIVRRVVWFGRPEVRYHPGYDTSAWKRVQGAEELVYRALVIL